MAKLLWRVKLVAELEPGVAMETEFTRFERGEEAKRLTAALQAQIAPA